MRTESCVVVDLYNEVVPCWVPDPCLGDGVTLWAFTPCTFGVDYSLPEFCAVVPAHSQCDLQSGPPLPVTGGGALARAALAVVLVGVALVRVGTRKNPRRGQHVRAGVQHGTRG